jgi:hypothetical protein
MENLEQLQGSNRGWEVGVFIYVRARLINNTGQIYIRILICRRFVKNIFAHLIKKSVAAGKTKTLPEPML